MFQNLITRCSSVGYFAHSISCRNRTGLWNAKKITWIYYYWKQTGTENTATYFKVSPTEYSGLLTYLLIYLLTPRSRVLLKKLTGFQLVKKFPTFYGTRWFITAFTSAHHLSLSWGSSIQSIPPKSHFLKVQLNVFIPSTPGSPKWSHSLRFPRHNPVYASPLRHTRYVPRPSDSSRFYHPPE